MEIKGAVLAFVDVAPELTGDYNRWYDLDHLPTHISRPEVIAGRRYVADKALKALRRNVGMESLQDGKGAYFTTYLTSTTDFDSYRVSGRELDRGLNRAGRMWRQGYVPYAGNYRVTGTYAAEGILVAPEAVPHLGHRGVVVIIGDAKDVGAAKAWWEGTGLPAALAVDGVHGAVAFAGYAEEEAGPARLHAAGRGRSRRRGAQRRPRRRSRPARRRLDSAGNGPAPRRPPLRIRLRFLAWAVRLLRSTVVGEGRPLGAHAPAARALSQSLPEEAFA